MKNAFKLIATISAFAAIISTLCACDMLSEKEETTAAAIVVSEENTTETTSKPDLTRPPETETSSSTEKIEIDSLDTILNNIKDCPFGTAGSTTKAYQIAYKLLNFTENSDFTANEAQQDYKNFIDSLSETEKTVYLENVSEIDYYARKIIEDPSTLDQHLDSYTPITEDGKLTLANYEALFVIISK